MALPRRCRDDEYEGITEDLGRVERANVFIVGGMTGDSLAQIPHDSNPGDDDVEREKPQYNCLGWVLYNAPKPVDLEWWNLEDDLKKMTALMLRCGYVQTATSGVDATVDIIGEGNGSPVLCHVIMKYRGDYAGEMQGLEQANLWESKLDGLQRVTHPRQCFPHMEKRVVVSSFSRVMAAVAAAAAAE